MDMFFPAPSFCSLLTAPFQLYLPIPSAAKPFYFFSRQNPLLKLYSTKGKRPAIPTVTATTTTRKLRTSTMTFPATSWAVVPSYLESAIGVAGPNNQILTDGLRYASVIAIESASKVDDGQWLAYWIIYSFLTLMEMILQPILEWIPFWYTLKLVFVMTWLVLPQFKGGAYLYHTFVRENISKYGLVDGKSSPGKAKGKSKFADFITNKKGEHEAS